MMTMMIDEEFEELLQEVPEEFHDGYRDLFEKFRQTLGKYKGRRFMELLLKDKLTPSEAAEQRLVIEECVESIAWSPAGQAAQRKAEGKDITPGEAGLYLLAAGKHAIGDSEAEFIEVYARGAEGPRRIMSLKREGLWPWELVN